MNTKQTLSVEETAQVAFQSYVSDAVRIGTGSIQFEQADLEVIPFSVGERYNLVVEPDVHKYTGVLKPDAGDENYTDNERAFKTAEQRLLQEEMSSAAAYNHCLDIIKSYRYLEQRNANGTLLLHRHKRRVFHYQGCSTCATKGQVICTACDQNGQIQCSTCYGRARVVCHHCHGSGNVMKTRTRYHNGRVVGQENYASSCHMCFGGYNACHNCSRTGKVNCYTCNGGKWLRCNPCAGTGWFTKIIAAVIRAVYTYSYYYPAGMAEIGQKDLGTFLSKTDWQVCQHVHSQGIDYELGGKAEIGSGVEMKVLHRFSAPRTCYHVTVGGSRAQVRHFGNQGTIIDSGGILENLVADDLAALSDAVRRSKGTFTSHLHELAPALKQALESKVHWEVVAAATEYGTSSYDTLADTVHRAIRPAHVEELVLNTATVFRVIRRRRSLVGAACIAIGAAALTCLVPNFVCGLPTFFPGSGCVADTIFGASRSGFTVNSVEFGLFAGAVVAGVQVAAEALYFMSIDSKRWKTLKKFAQRMGSAQGNRSLVLSILLGGFVAYGAAKYNVSKADMTSAAASLVPSDEQIKRQSTRK